MLRSRDVSVSCNCFARVSSSWRGVHTRFNFPTADISPITPRLIPRNGIAMSSSMTFSWVLEDYGEVGGL